MIRSVDYWPVWDQRPWPVPGNAPSMGRGKLQIIGSSRDKVRLSCDVCGSHVLYGESMIGRFAMCPVCGEYREVQERRGLSAGRDPERRVALHLT